METATFVYTYRERRADALVTLDLEWAGVKIAILGRKAGAMV
jgi:hypothetical protein